MLVSVKVVSWKASAPLKESIVPNVSLLAILVAHVKNLLGSMVIGRAKRAPHWGVQSRFRVIMYVGMSVVCQINCVGGITWTKHAHAQSQVLGC